MTRPRDINGDGNDNNHINDMDSNEDETPGMIRKHYNCNIKYTNDEFMHTYNNVKPQEDHFNRFAQI